MDQDETWYGGRPQPRRLCVRWGPRSPPKKGAEPPIFGPFLLWPWMHQEPLGMEVGLSPGDFVFDGYPAHPLSKKGAEPPSQFSAHVYCGQTAGWIKMPLGMEVGLGPGDFVFDGDPATPRTEGTPTNSQLLAHPYCGQTAG